MATSLLGARPWWHFFTAGRVVFGEGCRRFIADAAAELGGRVLVCTDSNLREAGVVAPLAEHLRSAGLATHVFDGGRPEMAVAAGEDCATQVRSFLPTVVVGLGGGSNLDLAKVVAARLTTSRPIAKWADAGVPDTALPVVALPTTAGTGSEVTSVAVLTDEATGTKVGLSGRALLPRVVLVDPELTYSCPPAVTAHSGMDALTHALEALLAIDFAAKQVPDYAYQGFVGKNPVSDALALQAIALIGPHLPRAWRDGHDIVARRQMALASLLAGMAFSCAGTAIVHALQYPLGARTKTPHGLGNATLLPAALRHNLGSHPDDERAAARALTGQPQIDAAALPDAVAQLALSIGITPSLRALGVERADLPPMAASAARITRLVSNNPRPLDEHALLAVLEQALDFVPATPRARGNADDH